MRAIIATTDLRATARYYRAGTAALFPYFTLSGRPRPDAALGDLEPTPVDPREPDTLAAVTEIERAVLEFPRGVEELRWLAASSPGHLFRRGGEPVGFTFQAKGAAGPIAALDPADIPAILAHVEARAVELGAETLELEVPGINEVAVRHLLGRGFRIDAWFNLLMASRPFGRFDRFIGYSPPIFL